jgi:hypothetical protein
MEGRREARAQLSRLNFVIGRFESWQRETEREREREERERERVVIGKKAIIQLQPPSFLFACYSLSEKRWLFMSSAWLTQETRTSVHARACADAESKCRRGFRNPSSNVRSGHLTQRVGSDKYICLPACLSCSRPVIASKDELKLRVAIGEE